MFFTSVGPQDTHCHTMYLLQLGTGFDRVLNTLALYRVVQLNSQTNASFTKNYVTLLLSPFGTRVVKECQFPQCYGSVGSDGWRGHGLFSCACRNIILHPSLNPFSINSGIQLSSSLACGSEHFMHGRCRSSQVPSPFLGSSIQGREPGWARNYSIRLRWMGLLSLLAFPPCSQASA